MEGKYLQKQSNYTRSQKNNLLTWKSLCSKIISVHESIRFAGVSNEAGQLIHYKHKKGLSSLMSKKEAEWSAFLSAVRGQTRTMFEHKLGKLVYSVATYEKVKRTTIYLNDGYLLLISFESEQSENTILNKIFELPSFAKYGIQKKLTSPSDIDLEMKKTENYFALGKVTSRVSHEVRSPLSVILANVGILNEDKNLDKDQSYRLQKIEKSVYRINRQLENILDFSREHKIKKQLTPLRDLLKLELAQIIAPDNIEIIYPKKNTLIYCDKDKFRNVIRNIIQNAVQAIKNNGTIRIKTSENKNNVKIAIENSGSTITEKNLNTVFDPLFTTKPSGVGLGLAISKEIVEMHGGKISVKNNPTTFTITLPKNEVFVK